MKFKNDPSTRTDDVGFVLDKIYPHVCLLGAFVLGGIAFTTQIPPDARAGLAALASAALSSGSTAFRPQNPTHRTFEEQQEDDLP